MGEFGRLGEFWRFGKWANLEDLGSRSVSGTWEVGELEMLGKWVSLGDFLKWVSLGGLGSG